MAICHNKASARHSVHTTDFVPSMQQCQYHTKGEHLSKSSRREDHVRASVSIVERVRDC